MRPGYRISGRYQIIRKVGSGGMANVYLAKDLILEREVAVKVLALDFQDDEENLRRFHREALATTELVHPNIVNIYDIGEGDPPYIVMEYVDGTDLKKFIKDNQPLDFKTIINIMNQILSGIGYAHHNHVIHRDLKPHNILINSENEVKITDFGIAVALSQNSITQTNSLLGSVHYLSPEQARGHLVTKQSDIYALGILLYEMLVGEVPFDGESAVSIALKHFQNELPSLTEKNPNIPQSLENVVLKATAKDPSQRYQTAEEMQKDLYTSLDKDRQNEAKFIPVDEMDEHTRVLEPIKVSSVAAMNNDHAVTAHPVKADIQHQKEEADNSTNTERQVATKKQRNSVWGIIGVIVFLVIVMILIFLGFYGRDSDVRIPDVSGLTLEAAKEELKTLNIQVGEIIEENDSEIDEGLVIKTDPPIGSSVKESTEINLYVSLGDEPFTIEDYEGETFEEIRAKLTEIGITVEKVEEESMTIEEGDIIAQSIRPGTEVVPEETTIEFTVSTGVPEISLRDLSGYTRAGVEDYAREHQLNLTISEAPSESVSAGLVADQDPEPGTTIRAGDRISVVISTGPEEIEPISFSEQIMIPYLRKTEKVPVDNNHDNVNGEEEDEDRETEPRTREVVVPNHIQIYISDFKHDMKKPVHDFEITSNETIFLNFVVEPGQSARYRVVRDGNVIEDSTVSP